MKRLKISLQVIVALLAICTTLAAKTGVIKSTALRDAQACYFNPVNPTVGTCVNPSTLMSTDDCTLPEVAYCCYTYTVCIPNATKVLVDQIILYRGG
jgi:hypothetical protein